MKVKVCGLNTNWKEIAALQPDLCGFIFYEKSPREVNASFADEIKGFPAEKVGVFVKHGVEFIKNKVNNYGLQYVQLHGDEDLDFVKKFKKELPHVKIVKVFRIVDQLPDDLAVFEDYVDYFLFDTQVKAYGGAGKSFDWKVLEESQIDIPFWIAGGVSPEDVSKIQATNHENFVGVDINSRFEISPGLKDAEKVKRFIKDLRNE